MNIQRILEKLPVFVANGKPSQDTIRAYKRTSMYFINWLIQHGITPEKATENDAREYVSELYQLGMKRDNVNQRISGARAFYATAIALSEYAGENPLLNIHGRISSDETVPHFFSNEEVKKIFDECETDRERALILVMAIEGLRTIEVTRMEVRDYDRKTGRIRIHGKGDRDAWIYPSDATQTVLTRYIGSRTAGSVFVNDIDGSPLTRQGVKYIVNGILKRAGFKKRGVSCHALRHSCGTNLYAATKDIRLVQETLRHQSPQVTTKYTHVTNRKNATAVIAEGIL